MNANISSDLEGIRHPLHVEEGSTFINLADGFKGAKDRRKLEPECLKHLLTKRWTDALASFYGQGREALKLIKVGIDRIESMGIILAEYFMECEENCGMMRNVLGFFSRKPGDLRFATRLSALFSDGADAEQGRD